MYFLVEIRKSPTYEHVLNQEMLVNSSLGYSRLFEGKRCNQYDYSEWRQKRYI